MGHLFIDNYSLLHFGSGIIAYYLGFSFITWFILHALFEVSENLLFRSINKIEIWPGRKPIPDTFMNSVGDQLLTMIGWCIGYLVNKY
jgi:hypothetical protein